MSESAAQPTPATIAAAIGTLDVNALRELAGHLCQELARQREAANDTKEIKRRAGLLAARAEGGEFGRVACAICGKLSGNDRSLARHIIRQHAIEVAALPAEQFQRGAA